MKKRFVSLSLAVLMTFALMTTAFAVSYSKTVNLGLFLDAGASGWFDPVSTTFSAPTGATVDTITIDPGTATYNSNNKNFLGTVRASTLRIIAPDGTTKDISWNDKGMTITEYEGVDARGTWTLRLYGTNYTSATGDYMSDLLRAGSVSYKNLKMTITCQ